MPKSLKARIALFISCVLLPISIGVAIYFAVREGSQLREQASAQATREVGSVLGGHRDPDHRRDERDQSVEPQDRGHHRCHR